MVVLIRKLTPSDTDARASFKDPTGEMDGTIHKDLLTRKPDIGTGTVLLLSNVSRIPFAFFRFKSLAPSHLILSLFPLLVIQRLLYSIPLRIRII